MADSDPSTHIVVVGAGLAGSMTALMLAQKGYAVRVYERNSDFRLRNLRSADDDGVFGVSKNAVKRSINLALSYRGQCALEKVGLLEEAMKLAVAMPRRVMHDVVGNLTFQPYGTKGEAIHSISREDLNRLLLDALDALPNASMYFNHKLLSMPRGGGLTFDDEGVKKTLPQPQLVIGADGAYSVVRSQMLKATRADFSRHYIAHGYKELDIPATAEGDFALPHANGLHIWPRGDFMMIALPNPDKTFTCTLFAPFKGEDSFEGLSSPDAVRSFFDTHFPDAVPLMPTLLDDFARNPTGPLVTVRVDPWNDGERTLLLGDAAHAVVPFYGQGMNAAFEDALCLIEEVEASGGRLGPAVTAFAASRQPAGDGIAQLSFHNYVEMRAHTASSAFLLRKRVEAVLNAVIPSWIPLYSMVAFTRIPYHTALERGKAQDKIINRATYAATVGILAGVGALAFSLFRSARR